MADDQTSALIRSLANARWRELLSTAMDPEAHAPNREYLWFWKTLSESEKGGKENSDFWITAADGALLIRLALLAPFPEDRMNGLTDPGETILSWFWTIRHPRFVDAILDSYGNAPPGRRKSAFTLLACQRTDRSARAIVDIIRAHGFPPVVDFRFFREINSTPELAPILLPELLLRAGDDDIGGVVDFINVAHQKGTLDAATLTPALPRVIEHTERLMKSARRMQRDSGTQWRFAEEYLQVRAPLGALLDVLVHIPDASLEPLEDALTFKDPRLQAIAALGLLARGVEPNARVFESIAATHGERAALYETLQARGRLDLFPAQFANFEAFAASEMVEWLRYPAELGREPEQLTLMATLTGNTADGPRKWCLWKFEGDEGKLYAAVSGPYELGERIGPVRGDDTFSNFEEWTSATPEEHLSAIRDTLGEWRIAHCGREM